MSPDNAATVALVTLVALLAGTPAFAAAATATTATISADGTSEGLANDSAPVRVASIYPNPVPEGDAGEFVVLEAASPTALGNYSITDGEDVIELPNHTVDGRVALATAPNLTRNRTDARILRLNRGLALANGGDRVTLLREGDPVETVAYADAPEGEVATPSSDGVTWRPVGATSFPVVNASNRGVEAFVLPDDRSVPVETLASADERILLAGYTLTSERVREELLAANRRGVTVQVLVDGSPVGGLTRRSAETLDALVASGVNVTTLSGDPGRYEFHHAKYAVVDDRALVTTENWKAAGTGGRSSRGWGAVVESDRIVSALAATFRADTRGLDAQPWRRFRSGEEFDPAETPPANGSFPKRVNPERFSPERVELLRAPDNAEGRLLTLLRNADDSIRIEQVSIGSRNQPFLRAAIDAARRGVEVKILLSGAWYAREENRELIDWLDELATREDVPLEARIADPNGRFKKIHAKGVIVDGEQVLLGSMNWNNHSARENREVALLLEGEGVGEYFGEVFRADWRGGDWRLPVSVLVAVVLGALGALVVARRFEFEG
ncbi:phospholipase D-like domain-containing protein [Halorientalis halophila]|uniref:phospholipase D-like domain-containing protein n=1 Tax=Halorientalis halophila TaxID=3108499 RepID=UPI003008A569